MAIRGGGGGYRRASFLPRNSTRPSLTSLLFGSIDSSNGDGSGSSSSSGSGKGGGSGSSSQQQGQDEGAAAASVAATMGTTAPSPVATAPASGESDEAAFGEWAESILSPRSTATAATRRRPSSPPLASAREEQEPGGQQPSSQQQPQQQPAVNGRKDATRRSTMMMMATGGSGAGGGSGGPPTAVSKGELASVKSALRQDLEELHNMVRAVWCMVCMCMCRRLTCQERRPTQVLDVGKRVKEIETDVKQRGKLQAAKDTSQVRTWLEIDSDTMSLPVL